jgi:hypothetical protein
MAPTDGAVRRSDRSLVHGSAIEEALEPDLAERRLLG